MTDDVKLTVPETAVMLTLMAEAREVSNPELKQRYGLTLDGRSRIRLNDLRYVSSRRQGRAFAHQLDDRGFRWCADQMGADVPAKVGTAGGALYAILANLPRHLDRSGISLGELFARVETPPAPTAAPSAAPVDPETRIRAAYADLAREPGGWVSLTRLRVRIDDVARTELDRALTRMNRQPDVHIVPESNQKSLSLADREAAVSIGDQDKHLLAIGTR